MNRHPWGAFAATALVVGLALGGATPAHAKVASKDLPSKAQFAKVFPTLKGGRYDQRTSGSAIVPKERCGASKTAPVKSARVGDMINFDRDALGTVHVAEFKTKVAAKKSMKKWKRFLTTCTTYRSPGLTGTNKAVKIPAVGNARVGAVQNTTIDGAHYRGFVAVVRMGKRVAVADFTHAGKAVSKKQRNKYVKLVAKRMN